jgi:hypothetical protein
MIAPQGRVWHICSLPKVLGRLLRLHRRGPTMGDTAWLGMDVSMDKIYAQQFDFMDPIETTQRRPTHSLNLATSQASAGRA